jgi:hypothetical protein
MAKKAEEAPKEQVTVTHERVIATAINQIKNQVKSCTMTGKVSFGKTKYDYANENDVINALRQACVDVGLVIVPSYVSHETDSRGNVVCVMDVKLSHITGAVWPYEVRTAGTCGQNNILGAQTSAMRVWYLKAFHMYTGDDPERTTQAEGEGSVSSYVMPNKDIVLKNIMREFPGATKEASTNRLAALNQNLLAVGGNPVDSPDGVTEDEWAKIARGMQ